MGSNSSATGRRLANKGGGGGSSGKGEAGSDSHGNGLSSAQRGEAEVATGVGIIGSDFVNTLNLAGDLSWDTFSQNQTVVSTLSIILGTALIGVLTLVAMDYREQAALAAKKKNKEDRGKVQVSLRQYFNSVLPPEYSLKPWYKRLWSKMYLTHDW